MINVVKAPFSEVGECEMCSDEHKPMHWPDTMTMFVIKSKSCAIVVCMLCKIDLIKKLRNPTE